jgi:hypothetical protein
VLHGVALGTKSRVTQARTPVFVCRTITETATPVIAIAKMTVCTRPPAGIAITPAIAALAWSPATTWRCGCILLHAGAVIAAHRHHRAGGRLGRSRRNCRHFLRSFSSSL